MSSPHASAYTAATTTQKPAPKRKPAPLPQPVRLVDVDADKRQDMFWAAALLNDDGELQAINRLKAATNVNDCCVTVNALLSARHAIKEQMAQSVRNCIDSGGLLFAFHGSKVFQVAA